MAKGRGKIQGVDKYHKIGRLKSPSTHMMGTPFQNQHIGDIGNLPMHGVPTQTRVSKPKGTSGGRTAPASSDINPSM
jgi:hypothetical protein